MTSSARVQFILQAANASLGNYTVDESRLLFEDESPEDDDLDGMFSTPHDDPPQWAAMLTAYVDESAGSGDGFYVIGGFLGNHTSWRQLARAWRAGLGDRQSLHMCDLRLGSKPERHKAMLETLGAIPARCGLIPICGTVRFSDYEDLITGTTAEVVMSGYCLSLWPLVMMVLDRIPARQRVQFVFAQQIEHAVMREIILSEIARKPEYQTPGGSHKLAGWSSVPMSLLLEPADYFSYAMLQNDIDSTSERAKVCAPILKNKRVLGAHLDRPAVRHLFNILQGTLGKVGLLGADGKKGMLRDLRDHHKRLGRVIH